MQSFLLFYAPFLILILGIVLAFLVSRIDSPILKNR